jgi:hypothetical protein
MAPKGEYIIYHFITPKIQNESIQTMEITC